MGKYYEVEDGLKLSIKTIKKTLRYLRSFEGVDCSVSWSGHNGQEALSIGYRVKRNGESAQRVELSYTQTRADGKDSLKYDVWLTTTPLPWGGFRYWFTCPLCDRRVSVLYLPPTARYFGCRSCYHLTYRSRNEPKSWRRFDAILINGTRAGKPHMSRKQAKKLLKKYEGWEL